MKIEKKTWLGLIGIAACAAWIGLSAAQEGSEPPPEATEVTPSETASEAPPVEVKPRPAEIMPLASHGLLLDITNTGERIIAVGDRGNIIASLNGRDWAQVDVPVRAPLTAVYFADPKNGWAVGHDAVILRTADGGRTWALQNFQPELEKPFLDVLFVDNQHGFAVGAYGMFKETTDGGQNWTDVKNEVADAELHLNSMTRLGNGDLFIAGEQGTLGVSSDQGRTWTKLTSPYEASLFGALAVGDKGAVIFGLRGNIFVTNDVRTSKWNKIATGNVSTLFGGTRLADGRLAMVGLNGVVFVTDASGAGVKQFPSGVATTQSAVVAFGPGLLMVGESGVEMVDSVQ
jgi:photosystem II stability/assembly factor-like uncharacterized protein